MHYLNRKVVAKVVKIIHDSMYTGNKKWSGIYKNHLTVMLVFVLCFIDFTNFQFDSSRSGLAVHASWVNASSLSPIASPVPLES